MKNKMSVLLLFFVLCCGCEKKTTEQTVQPVELPIPAVQQNSGEPDIKELAKEYVEKSKEAQKAVETLGKE